MFGTVNEAAFSVVVLIAQAQMASSQIQSMNQRLLTPADTQTSIEVPQIQSINQRLSEVVRPITNQSAVLQQDQGVWLHEKYCGPLSWMLGCTPVGFWCIFCCGPVDNIYVKVTPDGKRWNTYGDEVKTFPSKGICVV